MTFDLSLALQATEHSLKGHILLPMPSMNDSRFTRSVIYICAHSESGAMGLVINRPDPSVTFRELLVQLEIMGLEESFALPAAIRSLPIVQGGPVETSRGFMLHTADYYLQGITAKFDNNISLTASLDILKSISRGEGPKRAFLALGYAGWSAGQLEREMLSNMWLQCHVEADFLFDTDFAGKYLKAMSMLGVDPGRLSTHIGHA